MLLTRLTSPSLRVCHAQRYLFSTSRIITPSMYTLMIMCCNNGNIIERITRCFSTSNNDKEKKEVDEVKNVANSEMFKGVT